ncbi:MAG: exodeoxyribonuclease V subunit beta [Deltaproteobacteria bacterium]|nr:exodeoxyribonuclease V subunit beta [Deltaproteobacteria bacterium]
MNNFDLTSTSLSGINLIEASAGTGKTYAITGLFLRLILEKKLLIDQILVVTFTKAATAELKEKIRNILLQAKEAFLTGSSNDSFIDHIVKKAEDPAFCIQLIKNALVDFDKASIFTIHGFCQRILQENAFETGSLFDTELLSDQQKLNQEVADDFWRRHFYDFPLEFIAYSIKRLSGPEYFLRLLEKIKSPEIKIIPDFKKPSLKSLSVYRDCLKNLKDSWPISKKEVEELLKDPSLKGNVYKTLKPDEQNPDYTKRELKIMSMFGDMNRFADPGGIGFPLFKGFENFTASKLRDSVKKNHTPPDHKFFDICDEFYSKAALLEAEMKKHLVFLKVEFFRFAKSELSERKRLENIQFFDDLLTTVKDVLESKGGKELEKVIRKKYKAALVDEFQDTDPVQYEIFKRIFSSQDSILFMIGDPKQAIYSFRGADIFSYMKAASNADFQYTLTENWRSESSLIKAVNTIFSNVNRPFIFDKIPFEKAKPAKSDMTDRESPSASLILWYAGSDGNKVIDRNDAVLMIVEAVTGEIVRLLSSDQDSCFREGDIAVLVRTNEQARIIKESLSARRIHSVLYSNESIFESQEALEIERILSSISQPANDGLLRAALITDIIGVRSEKLDPENIDILWWDSLINNSNKYYQQWNRFGFIRMFRLFMAKEKVRARLLSFVDGQRRLTNVLHLSEILHGQTAEKELGMTGLLKWLSEQISSASDRMNEEYQLRLESDEDAVKIVTIHKCKGLEYQIVFCPFGWSGSLTAKGREFVFHDKDRTPTLDLDYGRDKSNIILAQNELLSENLRLLYVALTRAKIRCYLAWGNIKNAETSALAYLFHYKDFDEKFDYQYDIVGSLKKKFISKTEDKILSDLKELAGKSDGSIKLDFIPLNNKIKQQLIKDAEKEKELVCRKFSGKIDTAWGISSFSSLISGKFAPGELFDSDSYRADIIINNHAGQFIQQEPSIQEPFGKKDIFSFPRGARAGIFFHDIFEHLDFASKDSGNQKKLVIDKLKGYGFEQSWLETVCNMIKNVLSVSLESKGEEVILSSVKCDKRINEMEFYFPLKHITPLKLKKIFSNNAGIDISSDFSDQIEKLYFSPSEGFMKGYIDTIFQHNGRFYIIDWKSNFLGTGIKNYTQNLLRETIKSDYYNLQYYIYTLALHQYLKWRMPKYKYENDFGGVFYVFIRGVDSNLGPEFGIFNDVPESRFIEKLGRTLIPDF